MKRILPILFLITLTVCPGYIMANHQGFSPYEPPDPSDTSFVLDEGPIEATGAAQGFEGLCSLPYKTDQCIPLGPGGSISFAIPVKRVVGEVLQEGTLVSPNELVANGVVSPFARLKLVTGYTIEGTSIWGVFSPPKFHLFFNDHQVGPLQYVYCGECENPKLGEYQIPIDWVHFGKKNKWEESPTPGENKLTIQMDPYGGDIRDSWGIIVDWGSISFGAISPLVLVHGIDTTPTETWAPQGLSETFVTYLESKKAPFEYENIILSKEAHGNGGIEQNAKELAILLPLAAKEFGVLNLHIVAHSKGGLDIRRFLKKHYNPISEGGTFPNILSVFTIDTPHHGTIAADLGEAFEDAIAENNYPRSFDPLIRSAIDVSIWFIEKLPKRPGRTDLTTFGVESFNDENPLRAPIRYYSIAADADKDPGDKIIDCAESDQMFPCLLGLGRFFVDPSIFYNLLGNVSSIDIQKTTLPGHGGKMFTLIAPIRTQIFQENDLIVPVRSSQSTGIQHLYSFDNKNHISVKHGGQVPSSTFIVTYAIGKFFPPIVQ